MKQIRCKLDRTHQRTKQTQQKIENLDRSQRNFPIFLDSNDILHHLVSIFGDFPNHPFTFSTISPHKPSTPSHSSVSSSLPRLLCPQVASNLLHETRREECALIHLEFSLFTVESFLALYLVFVSIPFRKTEKELQLEISRLRDQQLIWRVEVFASLVVGDLRLKL
jgi:hypothetical protein